MYLRKKSECALCSRLISPEVSLSTQVRLSRTDGYFILNANGPSRDTQGFTAEPEGSTRLEARLVCLTVSRTLDSLTHTGVAA